MILYANVVHITQRKIVPSQITIKDQKIVSIKPTQKKCKSFILPGFIDAHIHIESSMLPPSSFAQLAIKHGSVATVSDPHEIANVLGIAGVEYMIENAKQSGMKFYFGASPCVPATPFETSGAMLSPKEVEQLLQKEDIYFLSEVMNFPGVIAGDEDMLTKIALAKKYNKPIDGHIPGIVGDDLLKYIQVGITTDHEAYSLEEAKEKLQKGMKIQIREGSAAKNYEALAPLIEEFYEDLMFCSDDKHPNDLLQGHINQLVIRSIQKGYDLFKVLQIACINPINHYNLDVGKLEIGDWADFIEVRDLENFEVLRSVINGKVVYEDKKLCIDTLSLEAINNFATSLKKEDDFKLHQQCEQYHVIDAINTQLITHDLHKKLVYHQGCVQPNIKEDILIITVINRYEEKPPALAFVHGFGLKKGAIASSVAHDSHNIIAVGCDEASITKVVNSVIKHQGGIAAVADDEVSILPLPIAGLMSDQNAIDVAKRYEALDRFVKEQLGSSLDAPFMTLSFMALLVIPELKLSDKGLFDGNSFHFIRECVL